jgi:hypothetical protein
MIETYIFLHDQKIALDILNSKRFSGFDDCKLVFLGNRPIDQIETNPKVIVARNLEYNIEYIPKLTSFTGWYALYKNKLINSEYVNLFEYDVNLINNFSEKNKKLIHNSPDTIGYFNFPAKHPAFVKEKIYTGDFLNLILERDNVDFLKLVDSYLSKNPNMLWQTTSNSTWKYSVLEKYILWAEKYIDYFENFEYAGHAIERSISIFYYMNKIKAHLTNGLMEHLQLNSHQTDPFLPKDDIRFTEGYKKLL